MTTIRIEPERMASPSGLLSALLERDPQALALFPGGVFDRAGAEDAALHLPTGIPSVLDPSAFRCADSASAARLAAVLDGGGFAVTTGQQPQLFGGPLYVLYKALTAVRHAVQLERRLGVPCIAVFWVAGDDHDWMEVASVRYLDRDERLGKLVLAPPPGRAGLSVGPSTLPADIRQQTADFLGSLEMHEAGAPWHEVLSAEYVPDRTFTDAFIAVAVSWTRGLPIAFLDSSHAAVRRGSIPLVRQVVESRATVDHALEEGASRVEGLGYVPQLTHVSGAIPLFREGETARTRLRGLAQRLQVEESGASRDVADVLAEVEAEPERYSPSAALRPVLESWLLPVASTVLGPGETAYWAQLGPLFTALGVSMPDLVPRDSWRVVEPRIERLLDRAGVSPEDLRDGGAKAAADVVKRSHPRTVEAALLRIEDELERSFGALEETVAADLPGLRSAVGKSRSQSFSAVAGLRKTVDRMTRERERTTLSQLQRAALNLYPGGVPQERAFATWTYLSRHGDRFLEAVRAACPPGGSPALPGPDGDIAGASAAE